MLDTHFLALHQLLATPALVAVEAAFILSALLIQLLKRLALRHDVLLDRPGDGRKQHHGAIPVVGGLAVFLAVGLVGIGATDVIGGPTYLVLLAAGGCLLVLGSLDDSIDIPAKTKLLWQIFIISAAVLAAGLHPPEVWAGQSAYPLLQGAALLVAVVGIAGYLNAINMVDGADGLAGGVMLTTALFLAAGCAYVGDEALANVLLTLTGGLAGFLLFNFRRPGLPRAKVFMGDAGTLSLGLLLAWCAATLASHNPPAVLWLMAYPVLDLVAVALRRVKAGNSPFRADRNHLHHLLLDSGLPHPLMLTSVFGINAILGAIGMLGLMGAIPEWALWAGIPVLGGLYLAGTSRLPAPAQAPRAGINMQA